MEKLRNGMLSIKKCRIKNVNSKPQSLFDSLRDFHVISLRRPSTKADTLHNYLNEKETISTAYLVLKII